MPINGHLLRRWLLIGLLNVPNIDLKAFFPSIKSSFSQQERRKKMAELVATAALQTLRDLLVEEAGVIAGAGDRVEEVHTQLTWVEEVHTQLTWVHCILKDADRRDGRLSSHLAQQCLSELHALAIEAEHVLEIHAVEVMSRREGKGLMNSLNWFACTLGECWSLHHTVTGKRAENIMRRMADLTSRMGGMAPGQTSSNVVEWSRKTYSYEVEEHFVGMKHDLKDLISLVTSDDERSSRVISIIGMGGLGKTTLATKIYQANTVQRCFDAQAWICVSQQFRPEVIFQQLLKQLLPNESMENMSVDDLVEKLYNTQKERKCLVVLDDLWDAEHWNILSPAFPITESSCKVLITTRNETVAGTGYVHELKILSEDEGWELLQRIALPVSHSQELSTTDLEKMEEMGRELVRKCGILPLAISVTGGMLRGETNLREWEKVCTNINSYLQHGRGMDKYDRVGQVLDLSYDALPYHLKPCFLYLGCFLEDEEIDVEQLYLVWMAEGLISLEEKGRGETSRDVVERYLYELASRGMVQVELHDMRTMNNRLSSCRLHDLVRDWCLLKAKGEGFLEVVDNEEGLDGSIGNRRPKSVLYEFFEKIYRMKESQPKERITRVPRLVVYWDSGEDYNWRNPHLYSHLRALMIRKGVGLILENLECFKNLKILILEELLFENRELPMGISKLVLLKHLRISSCNLDTLPRVIFELPRLQSMHLEYLDGLRIPNLVHRLRNLIYLHLNDYRSPIKGEKLKLGGLNKLETLIGFNSEHDDVMDLISLEKLQILEATIRDEKSYHTLVDHIFSQQNQFRDINLWVACPINSDIEGSQPVNSDEGSKVLDNMFCCKPISKLSISGIRFRNLPTYEFGQNLVNLFLRMCEMEEDPMETLGKLPVLRRLSLFYKSFVGAQMTCRATGFLQLEELVLSSLHNLEDWGVEKEAMPHLSSLTIWNCKKLVMIPDGLKFITSLQELHIYVMPEGFNDRIREGGTDYEKIKHIPSIDAYP